MDGKTVERHHYGALSREEKSLVRRYLARMRGLGRAQVTRLITGYTEAGV